MAVFKLIIAFIFSFSQLLAPLNAMLISGGVDKFIESNYEDWSADTVYDSTYAVELEKDPEKDFVIVNFADIQLDDYESYGEDGDISEKMIAEAIEELDPDLITLTGDNASSTGYLALLKIIKIIDSYGIPWAPVMGNHDGNNGKKVNENWCAYQLANAENSLFKFGPKDMGVGNYIINITENGEIIHTLYMMDTHSSTDTPAKGYDHLWDNQIEWYKWAVNGTNEIAGRTVESTVFFHIPCFEYRTAWKEVYNSSNPEDDSYVDGQGVITEKYAEYECFGLNYEGVCAPNFNSGFFTVAKELGSTKNMIAGHDHKNYSSILYDGIRLSYGLKTGRGSYSTDEINGASFLKIASDGSTVYDHLFIDPATLSD